jgi:hypothetical protein
MLNGHYQNYGHAWPRASDGARCGAACASGPSLSEAPPVRPLPGFCAPRICCLLLGSTWGRILAALRLENRPPLASSTIAALLRLLAARRAAPQWWLTPANHSWPGRSPVGTPWRTLALPSANLLRLESSRIPTVRHTRNVRKFERRVFIRADRGASSMLPPNYGSWARQAASPFGRPRP